MFCKEAVSMTRSERLAGITLVLILALILACTPSAMAQDACPVTLTVVNYFSPGVDVYTLNMSLEYINISSQEPWIVEVSGNAGNSTRVRLAFPFPEAAGQFVAGTPSGEGMALSVYDPFARIFVDGNDRIEINGYDHTFDSFVVNITDVERYAQGMSVVDKVIIGTYRLSYTLDSQQTIVFGSFNLVWSEIRE